MTTWYSVKDGVLPVTYKANPYDKWMSTQVLCYTTYGDMIIATLEHWEDTDKPEWFSNCSEHWNLDDKITHWTELPNPPQPC